MLQAEFTLKTGKKITQQELFSNLIEFVRSKKDSFFGTVSKLPLSEKQKKKIRSLQCDMGVETSEEEIDFVGYGARRGVFLSMHAYSLHMLMRRTGLHAQASGLIDDIMDNKHGAVFTSNAVFEEAMTFLLYKTGDFRNAARVRDIILGNKEKDMQQFIKLFFVDKEVMDNGWKIFVKYADKKLSFTNCTTIELMKSRDIEYLASFDGGFDGIVQRLKE